MDDTSVVVPSNSDFLNLLSSANSIDRCIQFSFEVGNDCFLSFLDVLVSMYIEQFLMTVCRKSFSISLPPHTLSNHLPQQKMATFYAYVYRALQFCFDPSNLSNEFYFLKSLSLFLGCKPFIIDKALDNFKKPKRSVCHSGSCLNPAFCFFSSISHNPFRDSLQSLY